MLALITTLSLCAGLNCTEPQSLTAPGPLQLDQGTLRDSALTPSADTHILNADNHNYGMLQTLKVRNTARARSLVAFDQQALAAVVGTDSLVQARLELTISANAGGWAAGSRLRVHRMTMSWDEVRATWNCPADTNLTNNVYDCNPWWEQGSSTAPPFALAATDSQAIANGQTGTLTFDVTSNVRQWLSGAASNYGWIVKVNVDGTGSSASVDFDSREATAKPRLVLSVLSTDTSRPALPDGYSLPRNVTNAIPEPPDFKNLLYRDIVVLRFDDTTSGMRVRAILGKYGAAIIGGTPYVQQYIVRIPDPGPQYDSLMAVVGRIDAEIGVAYAYPMPYQSPIELPGRWPNDSGLARRSNWFASNASSYVWWQSAVRLPLAWGCETGVYGGARQRAGVIDLFFDDAHPDLQGNVRRVVQLSDSLFTDSIETRATERHHGTAVAGVLAATGDNRKGVAGVAWAADLFLYRTTGSGGQLPNNLDVVIPRLLASAADSGVRVVVISLGQFSPNNRRIETYEAAFRNYIHSGGLLVIAAGNQDAVFSMNTIESKPQIPLLLAAANRIVQSADSVGIVVVAGTNASRTRWSASPFGSNYMPGVTTLAAPAENIGTLANRLVAATDTITSDGTSLAAPQVAGAAILLRYFDPTISQADVRRLLHEGTSVPRRDSTGQFVVPPPISNMTGARLLDVYGSLIALTQEKPNLPVCGYAVRVGNDSASIEVEAPTGTRTAPLIGMQGVTSISVAQGGRLIAVAGYDANWNQQTVVMNHLLATIQTYSGTWRSFLERDTVIQALDASFTYPSTTIRGPTFSGLSGSQIVLNEFASLANAWRFRRGSSMVSPNADFVLMLSDRDTTETVPPCCSDLGGNILEWYVLALPSQSRTQVARDLVYSCADQRIRTGTEATWSHDGRQALAVARYFDLSGGSYVDHVSTVRRIMPPASSAAPGTISGLWLHSPNYLSDDVLVQTNEATSDGQGGNLSCFRALRRSSSLLSVGSAPVGLLACGQSGHVGNLRLSSTGPAPQAGMARTRIRHR